ncbi:hypothetical protein PIECOFPK_00143 [Mycovorax composti]|uniref:DUF4872 domain-containing protein n=2 Tax=Chitinophagaceae TaxID=563835 RepID=A0ABZ2EG57_9BACT
MIINITPFKGQHCETTATGTLLKHIGIELSEPMLFGIGEGLGFIYWKMKTMEYPFLGGRIKTDLLTQNIAHHLQLELIVKETSSKQKAWDGVKQLIDDGQPVGLKLDCYHLQYFSRPFHFAGHYATIYGYDDTYAYLVDTQQQGCLVKTSLESLAMARAEKGPMASKNLYYTLQKTQQSYNLNKIILTAISNNAKTYLNPPITNIGYKGIFKATKAIFEWFHSSKNIEQEFRHTARLMEKGGTGGALFRNLYRDFLKESYELLGLKPLNDAYEQFTEIANMWNTVSACFEKVSESKDIAYIEQASAVMKAISEKEKMAMKLLSSL